MTTMDRPERLVRLTHALITRRVLTTRAAMALCGCEGEHQTRMIRDDLKLLAQTLNVRHVREGRDSRWVYEGLVDGPSRQALDALALRVGKEHLRFLDHTLLADPLETDLPRTWPHLDRKFHVIGEPARPYERQAEVLESLLDGLLRERAVRFAYEKAGEVVWIGPATALSLVVYRRAVYLLADVGQGARCFAVDRVRSAEVLVTQRVDYPDGWDPAAFYRDVFGVVTRGEHPERLVLRFSPRVARLVRERVWHRSEQKVELPDGGIELRMKVTGDELVRFVLEWGDTVEVVKPAWLRERVVGELRGALGKYPSGRDG